jgi:prepilin-type N-terminal cleavage/methylation domain-containing protein
MDLTSIAAQSAQFVDVICAGTSHADFSKTRWFKHIMQIKKTNALSSFGRRSGPDLLQHVCKPSVSRRFCRGFTLTEVVVAMAIAALVFAGVIVGLTQSTYRGEWAAYNLAAQNLAQQGIEQARAATWDPQAPVPVDNCTQTNFPATTNNVLDVIVRNTNAIIYGTNTWTIIDIYPSTNTYPMKMIRVDCTWPWLRNGVGTVFTNTVVTYRAPAQ